MTYLRTIGCKRVHCFGSRNATIASALATVVIAVAGAPDVVAQSTHRSNQACPSGYALISTLHAYCFSSSGDVVEPAASERSASLAECHHGYDRLGALCISPATGDVELAESPGSTHTAR